MKKTCSRKGFTLIEMLVVIGIMAVLMAVAAGGYSAYVKRARETRAHDKVEQVATAIIGLRDASGWPPGLIAGANGGEGKLDATVAKVFARKGVLELAHDSSYNLIGNDRFGVLDSWAEDVVKGDKAADLGTDVSGGGTVDDHILRYAICGDDGIAVAKVGGSTVKVRKEAVVWSCGPNGVFEPYGDSGDSDDIYSWTEEQVVVK